MCVEVVERCLLLRKVARAEPRASSANFGIRRIARAPVKPVLAETHTQKASMVALRRIDHAGITTPNSYKYLFMFIRRPLFVGVVLASSLMALSARAVSAQAIVLANISIVASRRA